MMNDADRLGMPPLGPEEREPFWDKIGDRPHYFDKAGNPISMRDWARLIEYAGLDYKIVSRTEVGPYRVSTVWLGLDHGHLRWDQDADYQPIIFETMVFGRDEEGDPGWEDFDMERYSTEEQALAGHRAMVDKVRLFAGLGEGGDETASDLEVHPESGRAPGDRDAPGVGDPERGQAGGLVPDDLGARRPE